MKKKLRKEILLVPPSGENIKTIRLKGGFLVFIAIVIAGGFAGYFIPFGNFSIDVVEQNRQKNLQDQNKKLLTAIRPMRKLLDNLGDDIIRLEQRRSQIVQKLGLKEASHTRQKHKKGPSAANLANLLTRVNKEYSFFQSFYGIVSQNPSYFNAVPLVKPIPENPVITARFEMEKDPFTQVMKKHNGTDFVAVRGSPVCACASGTVSHVEESRIWGKKVTIDHEYGFTTVYAHLGTVDAFVGKKVKKGDCIGTVGISGITSGPHLHYEVWHRGEPMNPEDLFFPSVDSVLAVASR